MRSRAVALSILIIMLITPVLAWQHPPGYGEICFPCHDLLIPPKEKVKKLGNCRCHSVDIWSGRHIDMSKLDKLHGNNICIKCHIGPNYNESNIGVAEVHIPHRGLKCSVCHGEGMIVNPGTKDCHYCHQGGIHEIHGDILMKICVFCHGKVINKFMPSATKAIGLKNVTTAKAKKEKPFSLFDILKNLFSFIEGLI